MKIQTILKEAQSHNGQPYDLMQMFWQLATRRHGFWWSEASGKDIWQTDLDENGQYKAKGGLTDPNDYFIVTCDEKGVLTIEKWSEKRQELEPAFNRNEPPAKRAVVPGSHAQRHMQRKIYLKK